MKPYGILSWAAALILAGTILCPGKIMAQKHEAAGNGGAHMAKPDTAASSQDHMNHGMDKAHSGHMPESNPMDKHKHHAMGEDTMGHAKADEAVQKELAAKVRVEEKLGGFIERDALFRDENNHPVKMGDLLDKPLVLLPIYFFCPTVCSFLQADLVKVLNDIDQVPGQEFNVVTLSFSHDEMPEHARDAKKNHVPQLTKDFDRGKWRYLTGTQENIRKVTDSLGFHFIRKEKHLYVHPNVLMVLAKDGKITRYIYGPNFLPFDVGMALFEADQGRTGTSIKRGVMSFCFNYDPEKKTYVFNLFRVAGTLILIFVVGLVMFFILGPRKKQNNR